VNKDELDPEIRTFVERMQQDWASYPPYAELPLAEARVIAEKVRAPWRAGGPAMADTRELRAPTRTGPLRIRLYNPGVAAPAPALVYMHGGGFTLFSIDTHDRLMREYAARAGVIVVGVDYPLSPEAKYPRALHQIVDLIGWLVGQAQALGIDAKRIVLGGDSAGGNLSVATALMLRDQGRGDLIKGMLLNYGGFGGLCSDEAEAAHGGPCAVLDRAEMEYFFANYVSGPDDLLDPLACPILADLHGLPPAFLVIPERDVLAEQNFAMAKLMRAAGVAVESKVYQGATHSFLEAMSISRLADEAIEDGARWIKGIVG
jgi:acetyl esterase